MYARQARSCWQTPGINMIGMTMLLQFVVSFGFILRSWMGYLTKG